MEIAIYGAGMVAVNVYYAVKTLYPRCRFVSFIVTEKKGNPAKIDGIPVLSLDEYSSSKGEQAAAILVAAPEKHHAAISTELSERNFKRHICVDSSREAKLLQHYYKKTGLFLSLQSYSENGESGENISLHIYMAKSCQDVPLKNAWVQPKWLRTIQAGAALSETSNADIRDDTGDNISQKNRNYCELTALYWIWKNMYNGESDSDYYGLFHYRRILIIAEEDKRRIAGNGIDVILPYPSIYFPSIDEHHKRYVEESDWRAMVSALKELAPEYAESMPRIFSESYFYNYNILIARKQIFHKFCAWLFPILKRTEELSTPKGWERADRYIGYVGESLTTLYFLYHKNDFKIAHADRILLT